MVKTVLPLSLIIALRFFGLFIVLPVLSAYALSLEGANAFLVGIVVGGYALTQTLFQVPFGLMSDKLGRKKTLLFGLIIFIIGSIIAALSDNIYMLMFGRFLQGAGAIGSVVTAMISDLVKEETRAQAMAVMGGTIAMSFAAAMIVGPLVGGYYGVDKLFWITAILATLAILILFTKVPTPPKIIHTYSEEESKMKHVFKDDSLKSMYITFLFHSSIMTMAFLIIPIVMTSSPEEGGFGWDKMDLWKVYIPAMVLGILAMGPAAVFGEKRDKGKEIFMISIVSIALGFILMGFATNATLFIIGVCLFFIGFNMFEPLLQSFVSKFAKVHQKGAALGVANSFAYFGAFLGGVFGGWLLHSFSRGAIATLVLGLSILWFWWVSKLRNPGHRGNVYMEFDKYAREKLEAMKADIEGIVEHYANETEEIIVVKYDKDLTDEDTIRAYLVK
ncbi:MAG: MFS transporter [Epsilonproteobacteria bacterium]|nr:MFS transporter [Campylobacterota bacterium]